MEIFQNWETVATIIFFALMFLGTIWAGLALLIKKIGQVAQTGANVTKETGEALTALAQAAADGNLTKEEILHILDEADDIPGAIAAALKKAKEKPKKG